MWRLSILKWKYFTPLLIISANKNVAIRKQKEISFCIPVDKKRKLTSWSSSERLMYVQFMFCVYGEVTHALTQWKFFRGDKSFVWWKFVCFFHNKNNRLSVVSVAILREQPRNDKFVQQSVVSELFLNKNNRLSVVSVSILREQLVDAKFVPQSVVR